MIPWNDDDAYNNSQPFLGLWQSTIRHRIGFIVWRRKGEIDEEEEINFCKQSGDKLLTYCGKQNYLLLFLHLGTKWGQWRWELWAKLKRNVLQLADYSVEHFGDSENCSISHTPSVECCCCFCIWVLSSHPSSLSCSSMVLKFHIGNTKLGGMECPILLPVVSKGIHAP